MQAGGEPLFSDLAGIWAGIGLLLSRSRFRGEIELRVREEAGPFTKE